MNVIKEYLEKLLENVGVDEKKIEHLKTSAVSEEHLMEYFGILEDKGIEIVSEYARLIAEVSFMIIFREKYQLVFLSLFSFSLTYFDSKSNWIKETSMKSNSRSLILSTSSSTRMLTSSTRSSKNNLKR